jgi:hypothetical protein
MLGHPNGSGSGKVDQLAEAVLGVFCCDGFHVLSRFKSQLLAILAIFCSHKLD